MNPLEYLQTQFERSAYSELTDADRFLIEHEGMEVFIYKQFTRKPFRKWSISEETQEKKREAIAEYVQKKLPIICQLSFGGYKLWRLPSSPEVDWAEWLFFHYLAEYFAPIVAAYKPGIRMVFKSDDHLLERLSNIPRSDTDAYCDSFEELISVFAKHTPQNMRYELLRYEDVLKKYPMKEEDLASALQEQTEIFEALTTEQQDKLIRGAEMNIKWDGAKDLTMLPEEEKIKMRKQAAILHDGFYRVPKPKQFQRKAVTFGATKYGTVIPIGTTKSSVTKFWTGFGILEKTDTSWQSRILSPQQLALAKNVEHDILQSDLIPMKNFSRIWAFPKHFLETSKKK
jgi:hypothetical protein